VVERERAWLIWRKLRECMIDEDTIMDSVGAFNAARSFLVIVRRALGRIADVMRKFNDRAFGIGDLRKQLYELQRQLQWQQGQLLLKVAIVGTSLQ
jgi:hypothetical protein